MNAKDLIIEFILSVLDGVLDVLTLRHWSKWQGSRVPNLKVVKKEMK